VSEWKLVPVEPVEAMRDAAFNAFEIDDPKQYSGGTAARDAIYRAMLSASPPPPDVVGALKAAIRAANLALFVIRKQGVMPNESWADGFKKDMEKAEGTFAQLKGEGA
jgi:hypothetical protein